MNTIRLILSAGFPDRRRMILHHFQRLLDEDLPRPFAQARPGNVLVPFKTIEIDLGQDVAEGVVGQTE